MDLRLQSVLREAERMLIQATCAVGSYQFERSSSDEITARVRGHLISDLMAYAVDNQILNTPDCIRMETRPDDKTTRFYARIYMLPPEELKTLLTLAFEAGRDYRGGR